MGKFFAKLEDIRGDTIMITGQDALHITKVLRFSVNDDIIICDGQGADYDCVVTEMTKDSVQARIISSQPNRCEPTIDMHLFQCMPKAGKLETVIQKAVELGVHSITPVISEHTVVKTDAKAMAGKLVRYQKIADEAAKQCGRGILPQVNEPLSFVQAIAAMGQCDLAFMPYEKETKTSINRILQANVSPRSVSFLIGPEGGFSDNEAAAAAEAGIETVTLGRRILRTETAPLCALSAILYQYGQME